MKFQQFSPHPALAQLIACYWFVEGTDVSVNKIVPDGFPEIVIHFGDRFEIKDKENWHLQPAVIGAGQLTEPLFLRPTKNTGVLGIKFQPTGFWKMFNCSMGELRDVAVSLEYVIGNVMNDLVEMIMHCSTAEERVSILNKFFIYKLPTVRTTQVDEALGEIARSRSQVSIKQLCETLQFSPRKLERLFNESIGVSAKHYLRLTRFVTTFKLLQRNSYSKAEVSYLSGYFDQSHFNKDFKSFSGENPDSYFTGKHTFANFLINR
jgi:AraC-like DNA-binding protein